MSSQVVGIFPASGGIGGSTVKNILERLPPKDLIFIARSPEKLAYEKSAGAIVRKADYDDTASLEHAFDGIDVLFLISYASVQHEHRTKRQKVAIDLALKSGVKYIFYGSLGFGGAPADEKRTVAHVMRPHIDTELYLEGIAKGNKEFGYTIIREGLYCESYPLYLGLFDPKKPSKEITIPHDGSGPGVAWVKREELGEGSAELIRRFVTQPDSYAYGNKTVLLSGPETLTLSETAAILGKIANTSVTIREITDEEYAKKLNEASAATYAGAEATYPWGTWFEAIRLGETAYVSPLLKELLGREPQDFESTIKSQL